MRKSISRILGGLMIIVSFVLAVFLFWPVPINPVAWQPGENPVGNPPFIKNNRLAEARLYPIGGKGPESTAVAADGTIYTGVEDGRIMKLDLSNGAVEEITNTGGRPLGLKFDARGNLIIADGLKGLLQLSAAGELTVLADSVNGVKMKFVDDLDIAPDGIIWFSDVSMRFGADMDFAEIIEGGKTGRLLTYDPSTGTVEVKLDKLSFANGVAVSLDGSYVLVNETMRYRVTRYWISGDKAGTHELFIDNLPGYPDNVTLAPDGGFWLALINTRNAEMDSLMPRPFWRKVLYRALTWFDVDLTGTHSWVIYLGGDGQVQNVLDAEHAPVSAVTNAQEHDGLLIISSLHNQTVATLPAPLSP